MAQNKWTGIQNLPQLPTPLLLYATLITNIHQKNLENNFCMLKKQKSYKNVVHLF